MGKAKVITDRQFNEISRKFNGRLRRLYALRRIVRTLTIVVYSGVLLWLGYCLYVPLSGIAGKNSYDGVFGISAGGFDFATWLIICVAVFWMLQYVMIKGLLAINGSEQKIISDFISTMFPDAVFSPTKSFNSSLVADSRLFDASGINDAPSGYTSYGRLDFYHGDITASVADIGVTSDRAYACMYKIPVVNYFTMIFRMVVKPIFGTRIDSSMHSFRGLFGYLNTAYDINGAVILLPDHLEEKIGYMAQEIQAMRHKHEAHLVRLEDAEFEKLFAVYADDEIEARKVLTPAMMRRITALRKDFGRDIMMSFTKDRFYYAAVTPNGFLRPERNSASNAGALRRMYDEIRFCRDIHYGFKT